MPDMRNCGGSEGVFVPAFNEPSFNAPSLAQLDKTRLGKVVNGRARLAG